MNHVSDFVLMFYRQTLLIVISSHLNQPTESGHLIFQSHIWNAIFYVISTDGGKQSDEGGTGEDEEHERKKYVLAGRPSI